jgi:hypothetical protein
VRCECGLNPREQRHVLRTLRRGTPEGPGQDDGTGGGGAGPVPRRHMRLMRDYRLDPDDQDPDKEPHDRGCDGDAAAPPRRAQPHCSEARDCAPPVIRRVTASCNVPPSLNTHPEG